MTDRGKYSPPLPIPVFIDRPVPKQVWLRIEDDYGDPLDFTATRLHKKGPTTPDGVTLVHSKFNINDGSGDTAEMSVDFKVYRQIIRIFTDNGHRLNHCPLSDAIPLLQDTVKYINSNDTEFYTQEYHITLKDTLNTFLAMCYTAREHCAILEIEKPVIRIESRFRG